MDMIMIACHLNNNKEVIKFRILNPDTGQVADYDYEQVYNVLAKGIEIDGIVIENGKIKGSNGVFTRYTNLINGITIANSPVVIVKQYPDNSYMVSDCMGRMTRMSLKDLIQFASVEGLANGKIVNGENGQYISPICGEYKKDKSFNDVKREKTVASIVKVMGIREYSINPETNEIEVMDRDLTELKTPVGAKGVKDDGFTECKYLTKVTIGKTIRRLGKRSFKNCHGIEQFIIEEGTEVIEDEALYGLNNLTVIEFPKTLKKLGRRALYGCDKLKSVTMGPGRVDMDMSSLPRRVKINIRRV